MSSGPPGRIPGISRAITPEQTNLLESTWTRTQTPTQEELATLVRHTGLTIAMVYYNIAYCFVLTLFLYNTSIVFLLWHGVMLVVKLVVLGCYIFIFKYIRETQVANGVYTVCMCFSLQLGVMFVIFF